MGNIEDLRYFCGECDISESITKKLIEEKLYVNFCDEVRDFLKDAQINYYEALKKLKNCNRIQDIEFNSDKTMMTRLVYLNQEYK